MLRSALLVTLLTGCGLQASLLDSPTPDAGGDRGADPAPTATAAPTPAPAPTAASDGSVTVRNPLGKELQAEKITNPTAGSAEHTVLAALASQAGNGSFDAFLAFVHPSAKAETVQVDRLRAYTWEQSRGPKAARCAHDGGTSLIIVARADIQATVAGGGDTGKRLSVWCGEDRMPVPFTLYPDGDVWRFTQFGLN